MQTAAQVWEEIQAVLRDGTPEDAQRAWRKYEARCWYEAHVQRGLDLCDMPKRMRDEVYELVKIRQLEIQEQVKRAKSLAP